MPASTATVSLDQAKDWARRLQKSTPALARLSDAQSAVATMLGHASWHALNAFYKNALPATPSENPAPAADAPLFDPATKASSLSFEETMSRCLEAINRKYPGLNATGVEVLAHEIDELEVDAEHLIDRAAEFEREGYFEDAAFAKALDEFKTRVFAPPGHMMIRVSGEGDRSFMTVMKIGEYR